MPKKSLTRGQKVIKFIEAFCRVPEGPLVGQPIKLLPFQKKFILDVYDNPDGTSMAILSIARKNGKTALIACLVLAHLVGPEAVLNSQICSGAMSRDQAAIVFKLALKMINLNPKLRAIIRDVPSTKTLHGLQMNTEFQALAADGRTAHGLSPILAILDEAGQVQGPQSDFVDAITTSQGAHEAPLLIVISTQAPTDADLLSIWIDDALTNEDPTTVCHLYTAEEDCDLDDEAQWAAANPAMGIFRSEKDVRKQAGNAQRMPASEATFRVLVLNQRVNMVAPFVSIGTWKLNGGKPQPFRGQTFGGLDLSATTDLTSFVLVNRNEGKTSVLPYFWMPLESVADAAKRDRAPYDVWVKKGLIRTTPGKVINYAFVAKDIVEIVKELEAGGDVDVEMIGFDRWRMDRLESELEKLEAELPLEPWGQGYKDMTPAVDATEEILLDENMLHGMNPPLTMCARNAVSVEDPAGNRKLDKSKATGRIDGMVALVMACGIQAKYMDGEFSPWDDPDYNLVPS